MKERKSINKIFIMLGGVGFIIIFLLNLFSVYMLNQDAATYFSEKWWSSWFPNYSVWIVFFIIGVAKYFNKTKSEQT